MSNLCEAARECQGSRVIALIDMDCFYAQVEQRDRPELWGKPVGVVQYNQWKKGALIAVNYEARPFGVKRNMRGEEAQQKCPEITLVTVPTNREKADLSKYRNASAEVFRVLCNFNTDIIVEKASIDEAFLDLTALVDKKIESIDIDTDPEDLSLYPSTFILMNSQIPESNQVERLNEWFDKLQVDYNQLRMAFAAQIVEEIRKEVLEKTKFHCSAGIAKNKMLAKLICSRHKPRKQTVLTHEYVSTLMETTEISSVRYLGGKLGASLTDGYGVTTMGQLAKIRDTILRKDFGEKTGDWIYCLAKGNDCEPVTARDLTQSIGCSKNFYGKEGLKTRKDVIHWLENLSQELEARLTEDQEMNSRTAKRLTVGIKLNGLGAGQQKYFSRQVPLTTFTSVHVTKMALNLLQEFNKAPIGSDQWKPSVANLHLSAGKFDEGVEPQSRSITDFFSTSPRKRRLDEENSNLDEESSEISVIEPSPIAPLNLTNSATDKLPGESPNDITLRDSGSANRKVLHGTSGMMEPNSHESHSFRAKRRSYQDKPTCSKYLDLSPERGSALNISAIGSKSDSAMNVTESTFVSDGDPSGEKTAGELEGNQDLEEDPVFGFPSQIPTVTHERSGELFPLPPEKAAVSRRRPEALDGSELDGSQPLFSDDNDEQPMELGNPETSQVQPEDFLENCGWEQNDQFNETGIGASICPSPPPQKPRKQAAPQGPAFNVEQCSLHPKDYSEIDPEVLKEIPFEMQFEYRTYFLAKQNEMAGSNGGNESKPKPRPGKTRGRGRGKQRGRAETTNVMPAAKPITHYFKS